VYINGEFYGGCDIMIGVCTSRSHARNRWLHMPGGGWRQPCAQRVRAAVHLPTSHLHPSPHPADSFQSGELKETLEVALNS
jgi:hypothetical protein